MKKIIQFVKKRKILSVIIATALLASTGIGYNDYQHPKIKLVEDHLEYEYGEPINLLENLKGEDDEIDEISWEIDGDLEEVGKHVVSYHYRDTVKTCTVVVKDTTKPEISSPEMIKIIEHEDIDYDQYIKIDDLSKCSYQLDDSLVNYQLPGTYQAKIKAKDKYNNKSEKDIQIVIEKFDMTLEPSRLSLTVGDSQQLNVTSNSTNIKIYSSDNEEIASVSETGNVTAKMAGTTNINVTINGIKKTCLVTVKNKQVVRSSSTSQTTKSNVTDDYSGYTVYITKTGDCYHRNGCRYLSRSQIAISKSRAVSQGYRACSICCP